MIQASKTSCSNLHKGAVKSAATGTTATRMVDRAPAHSNAAVKGPATVEVIMEKGLRLPSATNPSGAVAKKAAMPSPVAPATIGGSQRFSQSAKPPAYNVMPATARYDRMKDKLWTLSGAAARLMAKAPQR